MITGYFPSLAGQSTSDRRGSSFVIHDSEKNTIVVDGGEGVLFQRTLTYLQEKGITHVTAILTHWHPDHDRGLRGLLESSIIVDTIYCPPLEEVRKLDSSDYTRGSKIIQLARSLGKHIVYPPAGEWTGIRVGEIRAEIWRRAANTSDRADFAVNNTSMQVYFPELYTLITGDTIVLDQVCAAMGNRVVTFFDVPHHGNACNSKDTAAIKKRGAAICYYDNPESGIGTTGFTATGAAKTKAAGIITLGCSKAVSVQYEDGKMTVMQGDKKYVYPVPYVSGKWIEEGGKWYYIRNGEKVTGWQLLSWSKGEDWFFFDDEGVMLTGWQKITWGKGLDTFYFTKDGCMVTGWKKISGGWRYFDGNGCMLTGWQKLVWSGGTDWFYFTGKGAMITGFHTLEWSGGKSLFYFDRNGAMYHDREAVIDGVSYTFDGNGVAVKKNKMI